MTRGQMMNKMVMVFIMGTHFCSTAGSNSLVSSAVTAILHLLPARSSLLLRWAAVSPGDPDPAAQ